MYNDRIDKLIEGNRILFGKDTFAQITNYEIDISNKKGTLVHHEEGKTIHVQMDEPIDDLSDWDNCVYFDLTEDDSYGGTSKDYLENATIDSPDLGKFEKKEQDNE
tara:strand:- start:281 stop:598 length:318 start_codon:yes stop_codon:yes gene_type:complete